MTYCKKRGSAGIAADRMRSITCNASALKASDPQIGRRHNATSLTPSLSLVGAVVMKRFHGSYKRYPPVNPSDSIEVIAANARTCYFDPCDKGPYDSRCDSGRRSASRIACWLRGSH